MQSMPITTNIVSSNPVHGDVYSIQHYVIKVCQGLAAGRWFSPGNWISSTNKTIRHDITEILLKVVLNTLTLTLTHKGMQFLLNKVKEKNVLTSKLVENSIFCKYILLTL